MCGDGANDCGVSIFLLSIQNHSVKLYSWRRVLKWSLFQCYLAGTEEGTWWYFSVWTWGFCGITIYFQDTQYFLCAKADQVMPLTVNLNVSLTHFACSLSVYIWCWKKPVWITEQFIRFRGSVSLLKVLWSKPWHSMIYYCCKILCPCKINFSKHHQASTH